MSSGSDRELSVESPARVAAQALRVTRLPAPGTLGAHMALNRERREEARQARLAIGRQPVPCEGLGHLYASTSAEDHHEAATVCTGCPVRLECLRLAQLDDVPEGTYGGVLFVKGKQAAS